VEKDITIEIYNFVTIF